MFKGFGYFAMFVFVLLSTQIGAMGPGFGVVFISLFFIVSGVLTFSVLQFPAILDPDKILALLEGSKRDVKITQKEIEEMALIIRRDGMLVAETHRKTLKDKKLQFLVKRSMEGFDKKQMFQWLDSQSKFQDEQYDVFQNYFDRVLLMVPVIGLVGSVLQIMHQPISISSAFIPFLMGLFGQLLLQSLVQEKLNEGRRLSKLYFTLIAEGMSSIIDGVTPEVVHEQLTAHLGVSP